MMTMQVSLQLGVRSELGCTGAMTTIELKEKSVVTSSCTQITTNFQFTLILSYLRHRYEYEMNFAHVKKYILYIFLRSTQTFVLVYK